MEKRDEDKCLERADRLIAEGIVGERGQIASMILEAVQREREACARIADKWATDYQRQLGGGGPASEIRARSQLKE